MLQNPPQTDTTIEFKQQTTYDTEFYTDVQKTVNDNIERVKKDRRAEQQELKDMILNVSKKIDLYPKIILEPLEDLNKLARKNEDQLALLQKRVSANELVSQRSKLELLKTIQANNSTQQTTIEAQKESINPLEETKDPIKINLALQNTLEAQQKSIDAQQAAICGLRRWVIGFSCGTTAAFIAWIWYYTHK